VDLQVNHFFQVIQVDLFFQVLQLVLEDLVTQMDLDIPFAQLDLQSHGLLSFQNCHVLLEVQLGPVFQALLFCHQILLTLSDQ